MSSKPPAIFARDFGYPALRFLLAGFSPLIILQVALQSMSATFAAHPAGTRAAEYVTDSWCLFNCIAAGVILASGYKDHRRREQKN